MGEWNSQAAKCALGHLKPTFGNLTARYRGLTGEGIPGPGFVSFHFTQAENREMKRIRETK
jgi:hypothetical protein